MNSNRTEILLRERKAVFVNRDGTLIDNEGKICISKKEDVTLNESIIMGLKKLYDLGYMIIVITNQSAVAKKLITETQMNEVNKYINEILSIRGLKITHFYCCIHHPSIKSCVCRKPSPYFVNKAIEAFKINRCKSWYIGTENKDKICAETAEIKFIKIKSNGNIDSALNQIINSNPESDYYNLNEETF